MQTPAQQKICHIPQQNTQNTHKILIIVES